MVNFRHFWRKTRHRAALEVAELRKVDKSDKTVVFLTFAGYSDLREACQECPAG